MNFTPFEFGTCHIMNAIIVDRVCYFMKKLFYPFSFYFLYFAAFASLMPFFVLFYQGLGYSGGEIGLLTGIPPLITMVGAPFWTGVADSTRSHKLVMGLGILVAVASVLLLPFFQSFAVIFLLVLLFNIFMSPVSSLSDSATISMLGEERAMYGRVRLGGTIGWGVFASIAGVIVQNFGLRISFWVFSAIMFANFFVSQKLSFGEPTEQATQRGDIRVLLTNRRWLFFLLAALLGGIGIFSVSTYLYPYMAELGANETQMGIAQTIATLTELPIFFFGDRLVRRFTSRGLFLIGVILLGVRSIGYAMLSTPMMVWGLQIVSGMIFPAMWLAGVSYADENAPAGLKSTAQGLFGAVTFGIGSSVGGFIGGVLLESIGGRSMFFVFGVVILIGLLLVEGINRIFPAKEGSSHFLPAAGDK